MRKVFATITILLIVLSLQAQDYHSNRETILKQKQQEKQQHLDSLRQSFDEYRHQANEAYAQFMRQRWEEFNAMKGTPVPDIPEPPKPYEREKDQAVPELPIKYNKIITEPKPKPFEPLKRPNLPPIPDTPNLPELSFSCFGTPLSVHMDNNLKFKLKDTSENAVADMWEQLASESTEVLLDECLALRNELALCDWAYYQMLRNLSEKYYGINTNEAVVLETFLLAQSGYSVRIGRKDGKLLLLLPFNDQIYMMSYVNLDNVKFYIIDQEKGGSLYIFNHSFGKNDRVLSLRMAETPKFAMKASNNRALCSKRYPELSVTLSTNKNLMEFYESYPHCVWTNYSWAGLSGEVKEKLYPVLRAGIEGKSQIEAANRLINFVQTAFDYKTDENQFGKERSLFADETFYYPYSDCEDRAILFSILVRDLLGLDVVLLLYPDHMATAVHYTETLNGSHFTMDGKTWYISDPTYIGANVGECIPRYANINPEIYKL